MRGIDLSRIAEKLPGASGAEIKAVCTEAGMYALRERRVHVTQEDFEMSVAKVRGASGRERDRAAERARGWRGKWSQRHGRENSKRGHKVAGAARGEGNGGRVSVPLQSTFE
jgi:hypothetical protein